MGTCFSSHAHYTQPVRWDDLPPRQRLGIESEWQPDRANPAINDPYQQGWTLRERMFAPEPTPYKWPKNTR